MRNLLLPLLLFGNAVLLCGCTGTSNAGFSADEDALPAPSGARLVTTGPTYGATSFQPLTLPSSRTKPSQAQETALQEPTTAPAPDFDNLEIMSPGLKGTLAVTRVGSDRTDGNLLSVFAGLKNKSSHPLDLEVQTLYKDKKDHSLTDGRASWVPITLKPHEATQYRSVAITEDAADFVVRIRHASGNASP